MVEKHVNKYQISEETTNAIAKESLQIASAYKVANEEGESVANVAAMVESIVDVVNKHVDMEVLRNMTLLQKERNARAYQKRLRQQKHPEIEYQKVLLMVMYFAKALKKSDKYNGSIEAPMGVIHQKMIQVLYVSDHFDKSDVEKYFPKIPSKLSITLKKMSQDLEVSGIFLEQSGYRQYKFSIKR